MRKNRLLPFAGLLLITALACDFTIPAFLADPVEADAGAVATSVALTLAAIEAGSLPGNSPDDPPPDVPPRPPAILRIAYVDAGDLWLWTEGSGAVEIYDDAAYEVGDLRLSDDGQVVAFMLRNSFGFVGIWAINTDASSLRPLVDSAAVDALAADPATFGAQPYLWDFIPGSHVLAFNTLLTYEGPGLILQDDLRLLDADTAVLSTLLAPGNAGQYYYSPDGSQIALVTPSSINLINADGSNRRDNILTYEFVITYSEYQYYVLPRWSPDSSYLRVVIPSPDPMDPARTVSVWHIPTDGSAATSIGSTAADLPNANFNSTISPDLNNLAILRLVPPPPDNTQDLRLVDLTSFADTGYYAGELDFIVWSPDSSRFVFKDSGHLFVGQAGFSAIALPDTDRGIDPTWVDSARVLYLSGQLGAWELRLQTVGGAVIVIAAPIGDFIAFDYSN